MGPLEESEGPVSELDDWLDADLNRARIECANQLKCLLELLGPDTAAPAMLQGVLETFGLEPPDWVVKLFPDIPESDIRRRWRKAEKASADFDDCCKAKTFFEPGNKK